MSESELEEWRDISRSITEDDRERFSPPAEVWAGIRAAVENDPKATSSPPEEATSKPEIVVDLDRVRMSRAPQARRRLRRQIAVGSAAAAVVAVLVFSAFRDESQVTTHVALATNEGLPEEYGGTAVATAVLAGNQAKLEVDFDATLPQGEPLELWLIKEDLSDMRSLGLIVSGGDTYTIPVGLDLSEFALVDVSVEPEDGDPTHSGRSILRGKLVES